MQNLYNDLVSLLKQDKRMVAEGKLLKNKIIELALAMDSSLLKLLLSSKTIKRHFFAELEGLLVFDKIKFQKFISNKQFLPDSYTAFKNKIGLTSGDDYISENKDVVLAWPYKDCVLEGGQTKEDVKRNEIFWNETLAPDEIDLLLSPKVLTNFKKFDTDGEHKVTGLSKNDNLIIKGNNLLALHTIEKIYRGKVKLIYIDPPYNTGNDSFNYNDNFNHSTWLSFMKSRIKTAKNLLSNDGSIFIQIDDFESAYLKVLMDEIFGRDNFRNQITWKRRGGSANPVNRLNNVTDYILWYSKTPVFQYEPVFSLDDENTQKYIKERFINIDENGRKFMKSPIQSPNPRPNLIYDYKGYKTPTKGYSISKEVMERWDKEGKLWFPSDKNQNINRKIYLNEYRGQPISSLWTDLSVINPMSKERGEFEGGQKPEALLQRILQMVTKENDIILDFHLGSGTTCATAHKMKRRYIGIEQMAYIDTITIERLKKVIGIGQDISKKELKSKKAVQSELPLAAENAEEYEIADNDQAGISKSVNWQGGGSFVYCELAQHNQQYIDKIQDATTAKELKKIWADMQEKAFISYYIPIKAINENISDFSELPLEDQKRFLISTLDKNLLYIPYSNIDDGDYNVSAEDKRLNKMFYSLNEK